MRPLSEKEVDVVYKWLGVSFIFLLFQATEPLQLSPDSLSNRLQFLVNFFHGGGEGVPLEDLRNAKYLGKLYPTSVRPFLDGGTDSLLLSHFRAY